MNTSSKKPILHPYPETKVQWIEKAKGDFAIRTPWIVVKGNVDPEFIPSIEQAMDAVNNFDASSKRENLAHYFLQQFDEYPLAQVKPRQLREFDDKQPAKFDGDDTRFKVLLTAVPKRHVWSSTIILTDARLPDQPTLFDAMTVVTALRRLRLLASSSDRAMQERIAALSATKSQDPASYAQIMRTLLEHSLYITRNAVKVLKESLGRHPAADAMLKDFINSETGHDLLVNKSLKVLGGSREKWESSLHEEVRTLMEVLRFAAQNSLLSMAAIVEGFEGVKYDEEPNNIWNLLDHIPGHPNASTGVREHQRINDQHDHANVCVDLAALLPPVTRDEVVLAIRLSEAAESLRQLLFEKLYSSVGRL